MRRIYMATIALTVIALLAASSCSSKSSVAIKLDETPVISGGLGWGVVSLAYVRLKLDPSSESGDSGACRRGDVVRIEARSRSFKGGDSGFWYKVELDANAGWVHESSLSAYQSEAEARKAAEAGQ